ncbi:MAG: hypothetical protein GY906_22285 [bacterium]|nr:hypothetical protein [bacterium]
MPDKAERVAEEIWDELRLCLYLLGSSRVQAQIAAIIERHYPPPKPKGYFDHIPEERTGELLEPKE